MCSIAVYCVQRRAVGRGCSSIHICICNRGSGPIWVVAHQLPCTEHSDAGALAQGCLGKCHWERAKKSLQNDHQLKSSVISLQFCQLCPNKMWNQSKKVAYLMGLYMQLNGLNLCKQNRKCVSISQVQFLKMGFS